MGLSSYIRKLHRKWFPSESHRWSRKWRDDNVESKLRFDYPLSADSLVLDLGGYQGQWASDLYARYRCRMMIFEPVRSFTESIRQRFRVNSDFQVFQYGLGGTSRTEIIHLNADGSSMYGRSQQTERIQIVDAKQWFEEQAIESVALMKINIEGGEYELLERLIQCGLMVKIENIQVQFHELGSDSRIRMESIQRALDQTHALTYQYRFVWENWARRETHLDRRERCQA